jgi:hypothetical protein
MARIVRLGGSLLAATALALTLAGTAFAVKSGIWDGNTNQSYSGSAMPFSLQVSRNKVTVVYFGADFTGTSSRCALSDSPDAQRLDPNTGFKGLTIKHGKFGGRFTASGEHVSLSGQFHGQSLSGSLTDSFTVAGIHCTTGKVSFSAKPGNELI